MRLNSLQLIDKCDICAVQNLVYYLFLLQEILIEMQIGAKFEDFICMVLFSLIINYVLKLSRIYNNFVLIKPVQGNLTFRFERPN